MVQNRSNLTAKVALITGSGQGIGLAIDEAISEHGKRSVPLGRIGEGSDCAGAALLLCIGAGECITGQSIHVDGGMSVR